MGKVRSVMLAILATLLATPALAPAVSPVFPAPIILAARVIEDDNAGTICSAKESVTSSTRAGPSRRGDLQPPPCR